MYNTQEQIAEQVVCWNCEERVHTLSSTCPYCHVDLHMYESTATELQEHKITSFPNVSAPKTEELSSQEKLPRNTLIWNTALSLLFFLAGSSLFVLSIIIATFSQEGSFTISWHEHTWSAFFGLGIAFLAFGILFFQKIQEHADNS